MKNYLAGIARAGRDLLGLNGGRPTPAEFSSMCRDLLRFKGEAASIALADTLHIAYARLDPAQKSEFFSLLLTALEPADDGVQSAIVAWQANPDPTTLQQLNQAAESPRRELIRLLNLAPGGTQSLINMRADLLALLPELPELSAVDEDFAYVFRSWFNRGFLNLEVINWQTPAMVLEKLIAYEAVHEIQGWDDLRRRLESDRRCFGFFHPALPDEPLIFVEVALVNGLAGNIEHLLAPGEMPADKADAAIFYSISNCQSGLSGISFGNFLIKQVVDHLAGELPGLKIFATLSPVPGFRRWLEQAAAEGEEQSELSEADRALLQALHDKHWADDNEQAATIKPVLLRLCARYLLYVKQAAEPKDAVARFHLRNGARLERVNWLADSSSRGLERACGLMVNYVYDRRSVLRNHEQFVNKGKIAASSAVKKLAE